MLFLFVFANTRCLLVATLWSPVGEELMPWLSWMWWCFVFLSLSYWVSWVRCGTWLYRFLIFAFFLTFNKRWDWLILIDQAVFVMSQKVTQKVQLVSFSVCKRCIWCSVLITSDVQPMSINTAHQVQTDQCTVLRFQDSLYFIQKMLDWITKTFIICFCENVITITNVHKTIQALCSTCTYYTYIQVNRQLCLWSHMIEFQQFI